MKIIITTFLLRFHGVVITAATAEPEARKSSANRLSILLLLICIIVILRRVIFGEMKWKRIMIWIMKLYRVALQKANIINTAPLTFNKNRYFPFCFFKFSHWITDFPNRNVKYVTFSHFVAPLSSAAHLTLGRESILEYAPHTNVFYNFTMSEKWTDEIS